MPKAANARARVGVRKGTEAPEVLVGLRVPKKFHERIQRESRRRDMSLKEFGMYCFKLGFREPVSDWHYKTETYFTFDKEDEAAENQRWSMVWSKFLGRVPRDKVRVVVNAMEWDLSAMKSSRRKSVKTPKQLQIEGPA